MSRRTTSSNDYTTVPLVFSPDDEPRVKREVYRHLYVDRPAVESVGERFRNGVRRGVFKTLRAISGIKTSQPPTRPEDLRRVLIFRYDAIGDYIVSSPFISWLKSVNPSIEIDVIASYRNEHIIRADPNVSVVTPIHPKKGFDRSWNDVREHCRKRPPDMVAALVFTHMTKAALLAMWAGGDAMRVTIKHATRSDIYRLVFEHQVEHVHGQEHWIETMGNVGPRVFKTAELIPQPYLVIEEGPERVVNEKLAAIGVEFVMPESRGIIRKATSPAPNRVGRPYAIVNVAGSTDNRAFSVDHVEHIARHLLLRLPSHVVLVMGGPERKSVVDDVVERIGDTRCHSWFGRLEELAPFCVAASFIVTPDSAPLHMAAIGGVPTVSIHPTILTVAEWHPYGVPYRAVLTPNHHSINDIDVGTLSDAIDALLSDLSHHGQ